MRGIERADAGLPTATPTSWPKARSSSRRKNEADRHTRLEAEKKKKAEEKDKSSALPKFELAERQSVSDLQLSPDGTHVFMVIVERSEAAKRPNVPNYVTESSYTEDIPARTFVGDAQDSRSLAVMNLKTGKTVTVDAPVPAPRTPTAAQPKRKTPKCAGAWRCCPRMAGSRWPTARREQQNRWLVSIDPETGKVRVLDALHDAAWVREVGGFGAADPSYGLLPDQKHVWFLSERDGWMHLYIPRPDCGAADGTAVTAGQMGDRRRRPVTGQEEFYITRARCTRASATSTPCLSTAASGRG